MTYDHKITGRVVRRLRRQRGMSQEVLSGLADISRSHLAEIEAGRVHPTVETLWKLAEALELPLSKLFQLAEQEHRKETPYK